MATGPGYTIKCPKCKRTGVYITTDRFDSGKTPNGSMLRLFIPTYKGGLTYGYQQGSPPVPPSMMECIDCGAMLCKNGKLDVYPPRTPEYRQMVIDQIFPAEQDDSEPEAMHGADNMRDELPETTPAKTGKVEHVCPYCGKKCKNASGVSNHVRMVHKEESDK